MFSVYIHYTCIYFKMSLMYEDVILSKLRKVQRYFINLSISNIFLENKNYA